MAAAEARTTLTTDGVDLVDEDDGRCRLFRLLEQAANTARAHTDKHLDELRAGDAEERNVGLARNSACEQRLARARRAYKKATTRDFRCAPRD